MNRIVLVTGGSRSGKSRYALELAAPYSTKAFIATAEALDPEMKARMEHHQQQRDPAFLTVEEPVDLVSALKSLPEKTEAAVVDCITVWLGNLFHRQKINDGTCGEIEGFCRILDTPPCHLILVTNEVGMGIVPGDAVSRLYRDLAGSINQRLARRAHEVILIVCGIPLRVKSPE
ncbi:MAG: bifunctional adenosylcobinamide kinase/adenosylcobinamide-phosphate guanylyltransferase [Syntrophobacteria bacterium]